MFIGLKPDIETIPDAEGMKATMTTAKSHSPDAFSSVLQTTPCDTWQPGFVVLAWTEIDKSMH